MALFPNFRRRWQLAKMLADAEDRGDTLMTVPEYLVAEVSNLRWRRNVERASEKWATNVYDVPATQWQAAIAEAGRHRRGKPRER